MARFISSAGSRYLPEYQPKILDDGTIELKVARQHDLFEDIQSHAQSCDVHVILSKFANGDVGALSRVQGFYADVSNVPKNYAEILQRVQDGRDLFDRLPSDVRAKFGNDFNQFFASVGSSDWFSALGVDSQPSGSESAGSSVEPDPSSKSDS